MNVEFMSRTSTGKRSSGTIRFCLSKVQVPLYQAVPYDNRSSAPANACDQRNGLRGWLDVEVFGE